MNAKDQPRSLPWSCVCEKPDPSDTANGRINIEDPSGSTSALVRTRHFRASYGLHLFVSARTGSYSSQTLHSQTSGCQSPPHPRNTGCGSEASSQMESHPRVDPLEARPCLLFRLLFSGFSSPPYPRGSLWIRLFPPNCPSTNSDNIWKPRRPRVSHPHPSPDAHPRP